jgi:AraC-like DNA-binding protein
MYKIFGTLFPAMRAQKHRHTLGGFNMEGPDQDVPELHHCGEYWVGTDHDVPDHSHKVWEFYFQIDGTSHWAGLNRVFTLRPGGFLAVAPGVPHRTHGQTQGRHHFVYAAIDLRRVFARHPELRTPWCPGAILFHAGREELAAAFRLLTREAAVPRPHRPIALSLAVDSLVIEATRLFLGQPVIPALPQHNAVWRARQLLEDHPTQSWPLARLAKAAGLSPCHLALRFRQDLGIPPHQFLLRARVDFAKRLLRESDQPITEIALESGFSSSQHFAGAFRKLTNLSPRAYRAQSRNPASS